MRPLLQRDWLYVEKIKGDGKLAEAQKFAPSPLNRR